MNRQRVACIFSARAIFILAIISLFQSRSFSDPGGNGKISGFVFNTSHQPLSGVEIRAISSSSIYYHRLSYSAADGSYILDQLPVGQYYLRVQNKLGYLNLFYDQAIDKSDARLIKVNASQHIRDINFYLDRGGFISGHIYDARGNPLTTNTAIGFFDAQNLTQRGFINGNSDGSYISPALPTRPHIVKASAFPSGYLMTYYPNVSTQDSAQVIQIMPADTIKNIDFYLQKGGAISGFVRGEGALALPITDAWVIITDWNTGEWSSESRTNNIGYYCAAGLRPGAYRVQIFSVDPMQYHIEYYNDSSQRDGASQVIVVNQDTTDQINFNLDAVKQVVLTNEFIEVAVSDRYPGTNFSLGITGGLPETSLDDKKPILFGHPYPYTSFTSVSIDGKVVNFGSPEGNLIRDPFILPDGKSILRRWDYGKVALEQKITLVKSEWSKTKYEDTALIQYLITNYDTQAHDVGLRMLFDTMLGQDDAAHIRTSTSPYTGYEQDFNDPNIPGWWTAMEYDHNEIVFSVQGTLKDYGATMPDRFSIVNWSNIFNTQWDYKTDNNLDIIKDSGVALWWNPKTIAPGKILVIGTFLGLGEIPPDLEPPFTANHHPAKDSRDVPLATNIQLDILDNYMGVDSSTINLKINGQVIDPVIQGTPKRYTIFYDPPQNFFYNDTVSVIVEAADLALLPNWMKPDTFQFYIQRDQTPPVIRNLYPQPYAVQIPSDTCLSFILADEQTGVDKNSIHIFIKGQPIQPQISGDSSNYSVRYAFQSRFGERDSVWIHIMASDQAQPQNTLDFDFYFFVVRDSIAPWVINYYPEDHATEVNLDTAIFIELVDDFAGVDTNSIRLTLADTLVQPSISGDTRHYLISYRPDNGFRYNDQIRVGLTAQDLAKQPNKMNQFEFSFRSETDITPPTIILVTPPDNDTSVVPCPLITLEIMDEKAGVDSSSIMIWLNGIPLPFKCTGDNHRFQLTHQCTIPFGYLEWVTIAVTAQDLSYPHNHADTAYFKFRIMREKDETPPYVILHQPPNGAVNIAPECVISFHIRDDLSGVDSSSIRVKLNQSLIQPTITGQVHDYLVSYDPPEPFNYGEEVSLEVDAQDLAPETPNVMKTDRWRFTIIRDTSPPEISWIAPLTPNEHVALDFEFSAAIIDSQTGVDFNSLRFKFEGQFIDPVIQTEPKNCRFRFKPMNPLHYNQQVEFIITGSDRAKPPNWIQDSSFTFYAIEDHDPPYIADRTPRPGDTVAEFNPEIIIDLNDDIAGVDGDSILMTVAGNQVRPTISGNVNRLRLSYQDAIGFRPGSEVTVTLSAADLSTPPNRMGINKYSFFVKTVYPDLVLESFTLSDYQIIVHNSIEVKATVRNLDVPIFDPIRLRLWDNQVVLVDTMLLPMKQDEIVNINRRLFFDSDGKHQLTMMIDPDHQINETNEQNNSAIQMLDVIEGDLIVRSNPFTPNGDGKNDIVTFDFEKLSVTEPQIKLYDISGRMIITLTNHSGYKLIWDGNDHFGNPAQPGVYLYLLQDQKRTIANGYIVLAR